MRLIEGGSKEGEHLSSSCALGDSDEENDADEVGFR